MHSRSGGILVGIVAILSGIGVVEVVQRCALMYYSDGALTHVEVRHEKHPGVDDVVLVEFACPGCGGQVDLEIAQALGLKDGMDGLDKSRQRDVPPEDRRFHLSREAWAFVFLLPGIVLLALLLVWREPIRRLTRVWPRPASSTSPAPS